MSGSNKKIKIDELQHARKVKRSGTSGSKKVAKGGSAVAELAEAIAKLSADARTNGVIECYNKLVKHYDAVILAYVAKRDALSDANEEMEQLQTAIKEQKSDMKAMKAQAAELMATRRGCGCQKGDKDSSQAGRCNTCACHRADAKCTPKCGCWIYCSRPGKEKKEAMKLEKEIRSRANKIEKRKGGKAAREESESESGSEDGSEGEGESGSEDGSEGEEERAKEKKKDKKKSKKRDESDDEESEEDKKKGKKKNNKRDDSDDEEARPAAAASRRRDDDDAADSAAEMYDRLHVNDSGEGDE